ncbi:MAG: hypothetical protein BGO25_17595 [Acidobacteriales bacterium 59-55]|nr:MAG: hypothetical protein BGO25_17595 [Acidobacteriales bacterium 59-55]
MTFEYAGIFLVGILLAKNLEGLSERYKRLAPFQCGAFMLTSLLLYFGGRHLAGIGPLWHLGDMPVAIGAAGLLIVGLNSHSARRILNSAAPAFLGRISYSLYLVHGTVLFSMTVLLMEKVSHPVFFLLYLPTAIVLSWGFYIAVERPFMLWSRSVGRHKAAPSVDPAVAQVTHTSP